MTTPAYPPKPAPGDRIAVISPCAGLPGLFPRPYELGLERLRKEFGLEPVEYPATRKMGSTPQERADDIHAAFADPDIKAVMATIGGDDQITVLPLLDRELIRANPKPFFGYQRQHEPAGLPVQHRDRRLPRRERDDASSAVPAPWTR